jgi:DNA-binding CsgD family transcriptional regulator
VLDTPAERIIAASEPAVQLLSAAGSKRVVGGTLASVTYRIPARELERMPASRLPGYPTTRLIHVTGYVVAFQLWIRPIDPARPGGPAFAVIAELDGGSEVGPDHGVEAAVPGLVGSTDSRLIIDRISADVAATLGVGPDRVLRTSILDLAAPSDVSVLLDVLAQATRRGSGGAVRIALQCPAGDVIKTVMAVVPLLPPPSCAFVAVADDGLAVPARGIELDNALLRLTRPSEMVSASGDGDASGRVHFPGRSRLSDRELEVVRQLLAGDRVPAIARSLFLSQSTVRNYLSSVFRKLGVGSQQELLDLLRAPKE